MRLTKSLLPVAVAGLLFLVPEAQPAAASPGTSDESWRTALTLAEPTEIPGMVLQPGKYIVQVLDTRETRMVVQFTSADQAKSIALVIAVPNYQIKPSESGEFIYFQRSPGSPQALRSWIYPGNNYGVEFVYPKETAVRIAKASNERVYSAPSVRPEPGEQIVTVSPEAKEAPLPPPPVAAPAPAPPETKVAEAAPPPPRPAKLPATASNMGLLALAGLAALGIALTLRLSAR